MGGPARGHDAFPRSAALRAQLARHSDQYTATLELPDGGREELLATTEADVRAAVLAATRRYLDQQGHRYGRLIVADTDRLWELLLPADSAQEPVVLGEAARDGATAADATLAATVARTSRGQYGATLTLPDGHELVFAGAELDDVRARVLTEARRYLATEVGHPGRLEVTDPDGTWALEIPHDGGQVVDLASTPTVVEEPRIAAPDPTTSERTMPTPPAIATGRRRLRARARTHGQRSVSDRSLPLLGLLAAAILAVVLVQALHHNGSDAAAGHHTRAQAQKAVTAASKPVTASNPAPTRKATPATRAPSAPAAAHHKTATGKAHRTRHGAGHHRAAGTRRAAATATTPAVASTPTAPAVAPTAQVHAPASSEPSHTTTTAPLPKPSGPPPL